MFGLCWQSNLNRLDGFSENFHTCCLFVCSFIYLFMNYHRNDVNFVRRTYQSKTGFDLFPVESESQKVFLFVIQWTVLKRVIGFWYTESLFFCKLTSILTMKPRKTIYERFTQFVNTFPNSFETNENKNNWTVFILSFKKKIYIYLFIYLVRKIE